MDGAYGIPIYSLSLANELQQVLHSVGKRRIVNEIKPNSAHKYSHIFIRRVNEEEGKLDEMNIQFSYALSSL